MNWRYQDAFGTCNVPAIEIVAASLSALIQREKDRKGKLRTFQAIEDATTAIGHTVGRSTVDRMSKGKTDFEIGNLEAIARVFDVEVWQMLAPNFDPSNPPVLRSVGEAEEEIYRKIRGRITEIAADLEVINRKEKS